MPFSGADIERAIRGAASISARRYQPTVKYEHDERAVQKKKKKKKKVRSVYRHSHDTSREIYAMIDSIGRWRQPPDRASSSDVK